MMTNSKNSGKVIFDTNFLTYFLNPSAQVLFIPKDAHDSLKKRFDQLLDDLKEKRTIILIPAPVLAELLMFPTHDENSVLGILKFQKNIEIKNFNEVQAIETGRLYKTMKKPFIEGKVKLKFDMMILACAKIYNVDILYTSDEKLAQKAEKNGISCIDFQNLPLQKSSDFFD